VHINEAGLKLIRSFEGCRLKAYKPVPTEREFTIGWGHYGVPEGTVWTQKQADEQLVKDLVKYENYVNSLHLDLNENQYSTLVSFCFNCGVGCLQSLCRNRNLKQISEALLLYNKAGGKVLAGLTRRRKAEQELFNTPVNVTTNGTTKLPYKVKTKCDLNIRSGAGANFAKIRVAKKGETLTVWAIETNGNTKWGRNANEYFSLDYCQPL
jgi:GH24 family phage-related lysozyme (muramidase)